MQKTQHLLPGYHVSCRTSFSDLPPIEYISFSGCRTCSYCCPTTLCSMYVSPACTPGWIISSLSVGMESCQFLYPQCLAQQPTHQQIFKIQFCLLKGDITDLFLIGCEFLFLPTFKLYIDKCIDGWMSRQMSRYTGSFQDSFYNVYMPVIVLDI